MRAFLVLILSLCITFSNVNSQRISNKQKDKNLKFSLKNETDIPIKEIEVMLPDTTLHFSNLDALSQTEWVNVGHSYRYAYIKFKDSKDSTYIWRPTDYIGEKLYDSGCMTFVFKMNDSIKKLANKDSSLYDYANWSYSLDCNNEAKQ